jgi:tRNA dimethylallyltransferase
MLKVRPEEGQSRRPLVAIVGPTAVGKSDIGIRVAQALGTEVLTADSRQVYRGMDIGTDKPALATRQGVAHRLIDLVDPDERFNAGLFRQHALIEIERLYNERVVPLVVGGTGLYLRVLLHGLWSGPAADWALRRRLEMEAVLHGGDYLHDLLAGVDPALASRLHPHDRVKIIRALEVHTLSGRTLSEAHRAHGFVDESFSPLVIGLTRDRESLYRRIDARVDWQLETGLVEETRRLLQQGHGLELGSMKGLGYRQIGGYLSGQYGYDDAVRMLKRDTRRFAKRQLTWFRKEPALVWIAIEEGETVDEIAGRVCSEVDQFLRDQMPMTRDTRRSDTINTQARV